jgi:hypothetical protein
MLNVIKMPFFTSLYKIVLYGRVMVLFMALTIFTSCKRPIAVTHWSPEERVMLTKKGYGYPEHKNRKLAGIVCFNKDCKNRAERMKALGVKGFKGYKKGNRGYIPGQNKDDYVIPNSRDPLKDKE